MVREIKPELAGWNRTTVLLAHQVNQNARLLHHLLTPRRPFKAPISLPKPSTGEDANDGARRLTTAALTIEQARARLDARRAAGKL